jgi:predicted ABC-class ATPase
LSTLKFSDRELRQTLLRIDQQSYKAYRDLRSRYEFAGEFGPFTLLIDRVQGDPFASPSQMRVVVPQTVAQFPAQTYQHPSRTVALRDYLTRQFDRVAGQQRQKRGSGNSGLIAIAQPGQTMLPRTSIFVDSEQVEARFVVGLPAFGRRVAGRQAAELLCEDLPAIVAQALRYAALDAKAIQQQIETAEDADWLRSHLAEQGLVAFVADGAILPRRSGVSDLPLPDGVPFRSPQSLQVTLTCPNRGEITGMGIPAGITLIVGGGYHGKSTLLRAIELGVYNHVPGDGREFVVTDATAMKIRAEDGRSVAGVDISPFINNLPQGKSTQRFITENASGSTSQAANLIEALEAGSRLLLIDEDTAATNFMIRDRRMQALIAKDQEPITPFVDKVQQLSQEHGVSSILVMGGSGDYFDVATQVIAMHAYEPEDVTAQAHAIAQTHATQRQAEGGQQFGSLAPRLLPSVRLISDRDRIVWKAHGLDEIVINREAIDLAAVEQLVDPAQVRAIAATLLYLQTHYLTGDHTLTQVLDWVEADLAKGGFDPLLSIPPGDFAQFRRLELAAALNRWRSCLPRSAF